MRQLPPAGGAFARLTVLPAVLVIAWLVPGLPLLLAGVFSPAVMLLISVPLAIIIVSSGLHWVPAQWPTELPGPRRGSRWPAWFGLAGTALVAVGFGVWQQAVNSVTIVASRAPGAAFAAGYWISQHGSLPIPARMGAFGGPHPGLSFTTSGLLAHGDALYPRSLPGLPMLLSGGFWLHGISGAALVSPVLGALAVLAFGGLAGRSPARSGPRPPRWCSPSPCPRCTPAGRRSPSRCCRYCCSAGCAC